VAKKKRNKAGTASFFEAGGIISPRKLKKGQILRGRLGTPFALYPNQRAAKTEKKKKDFKNNNNLYRHKECRKKTGRFP